VIRTMRHSGLLLLPLLASCQQTVTPPPLRSLAQSGAMSLICRDMTTGQGTDIRGCPDAYATATDGRHTMLMVTQTGRGEVAVIDMHNRVVLDEDPTVPGTEFLPIGAMPVSIVSTPGGASTFVATAEPGREGIFAIPTTCIVAPSAGQPQIDLNQWSACRLPSRPGEMVLLTDNSVDQSGQLRQTCDGNNDVDISNQTRCPADWDAEQQVDPPGRRKILVTLPKLGGVAILDARKLFDRAPGEFDEPPCEIERWLPLSTTVPTGTPSQDVPDDLVSSDPTCSITPRYSFGTTSAAVSNPAGISLKNGRLYVADRGVPLLHVVDVADPCDPHELPPFLPASFDEPQTTVKTSDVAASDVTWDSQQFVYAVDDSNGPRNGTLMAFDASPSSTQRTPLIRRGSPYLPFEAPDRIYTNLQNASVKDLLFITHDVPIVDQPANVSQTRQLCDPNPGAQPPNSEYQTSSDYTRGAAPSKLRGIFAVAALSDGHVSLVDVDDWDSKCRRPIAASQGVDADHADWRGCYGDPTTQSDYYQNNGARTTSDETSCNVVERHRARSGRFIANNSVVSVSAPSLQAFPTLTSINGNIASSGSAQIPPNPRLLAVPFAEPNTDPSELFVGSSLYAYWPNNAPIDTIHNPAQLYVDPTGADNNSLFLPQIEPRAYLPVESFSVTFEGRLFDDRASGFLSRAALTLSDPDAHFCDHGVQDQTASAGRAGDFLDGPNGDQQSAFAAAYPDTLQITSDFVDSDPYWVTPDGSACAKDPATGIGGIGGCRNYFGTSTNFKSTREWQIAEAYQDHLVYQQIGNDPNAIANLHCCFPGTVSYTVRAAHQWLFRGQEPINDIVVGSDLRCTIAAKAKDQQYCDLRKRFLKNRVIEIANDTDWICTSDSTGVQTCKCDPDDSGKCSIGPAIANDLACVVHNPVNSSNYATSLESLGKGCVFDSLKARFAVYRGANPSARDMSFVWQVIGGFVPYELSVLNRLTGFAVMPLSMTPAPNLNALFVVDGVSGGIFEIALDPFVVNGDPYL
jgi:hypothetical protein